MLQRVLRMITYDNLQQSVAAWLLSHPGQRIKLPLKPLRQSGIREFHEFESWTERYSLQAKSCGTYFFIWHGELPPSAAAPPVFTNIDQLHPGNRFRVMFGQTLLHQSPSDGNILRGGNAQKNY